MVRSSQVERETKETRIRLRLDLDGTMQAVDTGIGFFDHMLTALFFYAGFGAELTVEGDLHVDGHHTVEDTGIVLGQAIREALGEKAGIRRFASAYVPMDEALGFTALDFSGRPFLVIDAVMPQPAMGGYDSALTEEFMRALAQHGGITLHQTATGKNAHHMTEALFKSLGLAMRDAVEIRGTGAVSTKGKLD